MDVTEAVLLIPEGMSSRKMASKYEGACFNLNLVCIAVKPNPVDDLRFIKTEDSSDVNLTWKFPSQLPTAINLAYRICVKSVEGWDDRILVSYFCTSTVCVWL